MKKLFAPVIVLMVLVLSGCTNPIVKEEVSNSQVTIPVKQVTRIDELQLEGFINDYIYRRQIKDSSLFDDFHAYGSVLSNSIVVYVYPKDSFSEMRSEDIKQKLEKGLFSTLLDFPDFDWAKNYSFDIVIR